MLFTLLEPSGDFKDRGSGDLIDLAIGDLIDLAVGDFIDLGGDKMPLDPIYFCNPLPISYLSSGTPSLAVFGAILYFDISTMFSCINYR